VGDEFPHVEGVTHRYVDAGGLRVHLAEAGDPSAPAVLLLHGWPQHWYMWRRVIEALCGEYRLLAPDLRGFGWTDAPGRGYDCEAFAADQVALLDALGIERVKLIGHDWGGWTSFLLGILHADRVERMVVLNDPHPWPPVGLRLYPQVRRGWYAWVLASPGLGTWSLRHGWITRNILSRGNVGTPFSDEELAMYVDSFRPPERARAVSHLYRYYQRAFREVVTGRWRDRRLVAPTLLLFGEQDRYISPRLLEGGEAHGDDLRIELVPDSGHFIVDEKPELVVDRARAFLGG
jgi:pimeloyl-ACP methyl ester carboxylesterase